MKKFELSGNLMIDTSFISFYETIISHEKIFEANDFNKYHKFFFDFVKEDIPDIQKELEYFNFSDVDDKQLKKYLDRQSWLLKMAINEKNARTAFDILCSIGEEIVSKVRDFQVCKTMSIESTSITFENIEFILSNLLLENVMVSSINTSTCCVKEDNNSCFYGNPIESDSFLYIS